MAVNEASDGRSRSRWGERYLRPRPRRNEGLAQVKTTIRTSLLGAAAAMVLLAGLTACASNSSTPPAAGSTSAAASSSDSKSSAAVSSTADSAKAGSSGSASAADGLAGTTFVATEVTGKYTIAPGSTISLTVVDDESLSAQPGCNTMNGAYTITGDVLSAPVMASTMMACVDTALMDQDTWFAAFLASSPTFSYADGVLTLTDGTDTIAFTGAPSGAAAIEGTGWKLTDLISVSGSTVAAVDPTLSAWIRFNAAEVAFNNSCNSGGGTAEIGDADITFGPLRSTLIGCEGPSGALEAAMNAVLQGVTPYTVTTDPSGTRLKIMSTDGVTGLGFVADPTVGADAFPSATGSAAVTSSG
jgi:heat shock protein HslJ